jgi:hypothetical protein
MIRSSSGTEGNEQGGVYVIKDPRTSFHFPDDERVIVQFEWEGEPGHHEFEGRWKNADGKTVMVSEFEYESPGRRFGAYWILELKENVKPGLWALEAVVDGQVAGMHAFQILSEATPEDLQAGRPRLTPSEIYEKLVISTVFVDKFSEAGEKLGTASGYVLRDERVLTVFQAIDGATAVRVRLADGTEVEVNQVTAWNRLENWALLIAPTISAASLDTAPSDAFAIGDQCYSLGTPTDTVRVLRECRLVGRQATEYVGERINLELSIDDSMVGGPIVDGYGDVIAIVTQGDLIPGVTSIGNRYTSRPSNLPYAILNQSFGARVGPLSATGFSEETASFGELRAKHQFLEPLVENEHLGSGTLTRGIDRSDKKHPRPLDDVFELPPGTISVFLRWNPLAKFESQLRVRVYNLENELLLETEPAKVKLKAYDMAYGMLELDTSRLKAGIYRVDAVLTEGTCWRSFFKIIT